MHGRVKVRTTAEKEAILNAERAKKVKEYRAVMSLLFQKRKNKAWDQEYLGHISKILLKIPDMTTLWNMRREVFETMDPKSEEYVEQLKSELTLTEQCLVENPKSYSTWDHRCWVIEHLPEHNWKKELDLCAKYLNLDERNFHCWDYRNFLVAKAKVSDEEEFEFSTSKIYANFSNYSSWHYRSKVLSNLFPNDKNSLPIREDKYKEELDLVKSATFTDPNDSSAWFYQRWLLEPRISSTATVCKIRLDKNQATISFHKELELNLTKVSLLIDNNPINCDWTSISRKRFSKLYSTKFSEPLSIIQDSSVLVKFDGRDFPLSKIDSKDIWTNLKTDICLDGYNKSHLIEQLEDYKTLAEMEPDNKWALLTGIYLMKNIDFVQFYSKIIETLGVLKEKDHLRENYYNDLRSKYVLEYNLICKSDGADQLNVNLSGLDLTAIYYEQYLSAFEEVNLSDNRLNRSLNQLYALQNCTKLNLSGNGVYSLISLPTLGKLKTLSLQNNQISRVEDVVSFVSRHQIEEIDLRSNPIDRTVVEAVEKAGCKTRVVVDAE